MCALMVATRGMFNRNITLDDAGVRRGATLVAWDDIDHYRYDCQDWSRASDFVLVTRSAQLIRISPVFDQGPVVAERILRELHPRLRAEAYFDPFRLDDAALVHRSLGRLPLADFVRLELAFVGSSMVAIVHARDAGEWAQVDTSDIANLWLWLDQLAERGIAIASPVRLHLPPVLTKLADWIAADRVLPRATVIPPRRR